MRLSLAKVSPIILSIAMFGCGGKTAPSSAPADVPAPSQTTGVPVSRVDDPAVDVVMPIEEAPLPEIPSISLSGSSSPTSGTVKEGTVTTSTPADEKRRLLLDAMKPVQVMLGSWKGTTQKEVGDFKALTNPEWVWDFQTNRDQPAMVMKSPESPYFQEARLTYLPDDEKFKLTTTDGEGKVREFVGEYASPVEEFQGDDQKMHVKYKLQLQQTNGESARDTWQVTFNQQENHRYLVELARKSGTNFIRFDTIASQREGTSFGKSDESYGERECIISGGLGVTQVSYGGKNYWVCCSGCKAAFDEDPKSWIAEWEAKKAAKEGS